MLNQKGVDFINNLKIVSDLGFDQLAVLTHAYHESGAFNHAIGLANFWGIKPPHTWTGKVIPTVTHEFINGQKIQVTTNFIDFDTIAEGLQWYCAFIQRMYPNAYNNRQNSEQYFNGLIDGKYQYATDPKYVPTLINLYNELKNNTEITALLNNTTKPQETVLSSDSADTSEKTV